MTVKFPSLKKLMDFLRVSGIANCEFSRSQFTLTSDFLHTEADLASTYDAIILDGDTGQRQNESEPIYPYLNL